jgi:hypothetical protein
VPSKRDRDVIHRHRLAMAAAQPTSSIESSNPVVRIVDFEAVRSLVLDSLRCVVVPLRIFQESDGVHRYAKSQ